MTDEETTPSPIDRLLDQERLLLRRLDPHQAEAAVRAGGVIVDTRSDGEYTGQVVRSARGGAIPGAVHLEWTNNLDANGFFKPADELKEMYAERNITPEKDVIPHCQGAYRSAHTYLALRLIGYPKVRNYLGSWGEWGNRPDLPIEHPTKP